MQQAFVFEKVAVLVRTWHEPMEPPERGARVEVRLLADEPRRGSRSAAQRVVIDQPVFRADLFEGVEPCDRHWRDEIRADPAGWLEAQLGDLRRLLEESGVDVTHAPWIEGDAAALLDAIPNISAAVD